MKNLEGGLNMIVDNATVLKIKKLVPEATIPSYSREGDAAVDLTATSRAFTPEYIEYGVGLAVKIPDGHVGLVFPRSSVSKFGLSLANAVAVIDSNYTGEIKLRFRRLDFGTMYDVGDRVGQLLVLPLPKIIFDEVDELCDTNRGDGAFGSSGI